MRSRRLALIRPYSDRDHRITRSLSSSMPGMRTDRRDVDAEQATGGLPALVVGCVEEDAFVARHSQPCVLCKFALQLAGAPACITERDEGIEGPVPLAIELRISGDVVT